MARNSLFSPAVAALLAAATGTAATPGIGVASAPATYSVDATPVTGPSEVFDGTAVDTGRSPGEVHLKSGADVRLEASSQGTLFSDHLELRAGAARVSHFDNYPVRARELRIETESPETQAVVRAGRQTVEIASLGGPVKVYDGDALLASVAAGTRAAFQTATPSQSGASPAPSANPAQSGANPAQSGANPAQSVANPAKRPGAISDKKAILWAAGICAVGGLVVGLLAASEGKSPF